VTPSGQQTNSRSHITMASKTDGTSPTSRISVREERGMRNKTHKNARGGANPSVQNISTWGWTSVNFQSVKHQRIDGFVGEKKG